MMYRVRKTMRLDPDTQALIERRMRERGLTFNQAVNEAIRAGLDRRSSRARRSFTVPRDLGGARVDVTATLKLAAQLEDNALACRLVEGR